MVSDKVFNTDGTQKIFSSDFAIISEDHLRVYLGASIVSRDDYDLINNAAVFNTAPTTGQVITVQVGTTPADILTSPTDAGIVAANIADVNTVADISGDVTTVAGIEADVTTVAADGTDIGIVATNIASVNTTATNITNVNTVAGNTTNINTVAGNDADISTVAGIDADVTTVAGNDANVTTVAGISANTTTVASIAANVTTVATNDTNVTTVAGSITNVNTVGTNIADVNTVAGIGAAGLAGIVANETNINTVGTNIASVNTTATDIANVNIVATNISDVNTVADDIAKVIKVADDLSEAISEVETVANDLNETTSEIDTVATNIANVNIVGTGIANVNAVSGNATNINAVAGNATNINAVQANEADIDTVAGNTANINTVAGISANVTTVATNDANVTIVASNIADVNNFADTYFTGATAPSSPTLGDLWFDSVANTMKVYAASGWANAGSSVNGVENSVEHTATAGQTSFAATYDAGNLNVFLNGVKLDTSDYTATDGANVVLNTGATVGDSLFVQSFGTFELADHYTKIVSDARFEPIDSTILKDADIGTSVLSPTGDGSALTGIDALPTQTGHNGKYLGTNGTDATWNTLDTDANSTTKGLYEHANTISANYSITAGNNALTAGPITINTGVSVSIPTGSTWVIT